MPLDICYLQKYLVWKRNIKLNDVLESYVSIEEKQKEAPVEIILPAPPEKPAVVGGSQEQKRYFKTPLQDQRNVMAFNLMGSNNGGKLAILGCGALSFEKYSLKDLADKGIRHVVSVDIDETALSCGKESMDRHLDQMEAETVKRSGHPVHIELYKGDLLAPSPVLSNVGIAISTEVIEHMPVEKASQLLRGVLEKIRPKVYIVSTPNAEYNVAFNMKTIFRHHDHHFEFTREEFKNWLCANVMKPYKFEIYFVGQIEGYEALEGATQFAKIWKEDGTSGNVITENRGAYKKVGDFVYRCNYLRVFEGVVVGAFKRFIEGFAFDPAKQTMDGRCFVWRVSVERILLYGVKPTMEIDERDAMLLLTSLFDIICFKAIDRKTKKLSIDISPVANKHALLNFISHCALL